MHGVIGLGNVGREFTQTRHNLGRRATEAFAHPAPFHRASRFQGEVAMTYVAKSHPVCCVLPRCYMNQSGPVVAAAIRELELTLDHTLIVSDDIALPFGKLRLRAQGSSGGHNGLKSVEASLGTQQFPRLRIGIGAPPEGVALEEFVLSPLTTQEERELPEIFDRIFHLLADWVSRGATAAMPPIPPQEKGDQ